MSNSTQHKLSKIRPPRVQITYDVETGDDVQMKELPLVVGVMADLSAETEKPKQKLKKRKFVDIDGENFNEVMEAIEPRVELSVENKLTEDDTKLNMALKFSEIDDFKPLSIIKQVPALNKLFEARSHLADLLGKLDGNDRLDEMLTQIVANTPELEEIKAATATAKPEAAEGEAAEGDEKPDEEKDEG